MSSIIFTVTFKAAVINTNKVALTKLLNEKLFVSLKRIVVYKIEYCQKYAMLVSDIDSNKFFFPNGSSN